MKPTLMHITCTGIDQTTDLGRLCLLQKMFPIAEFGVLLSAKPQDSPRYPGTEFIHSLRGLGLNLALHLCGSLAREAAVGNWNPTEDLLGDAFSLFRRIQLNIAGYAKERFPEGLSVSVPESAREVIIQQKGTDDCDLGLDAAARNSHVSLLLDASGGRGVYATPKAPKPLWRSYKVGFAGGLDKNAIKDAMPVILASKNVDLFWVDAEGRLRNDDDTFSIHRATMFLDAATAAYGNA